jgi:hypothetical protein
MKVTVPVAVTGPTVAVRVTGWPKADVAGWARVVVVGVRPAGPTVSITGGVEVLVRKLLSPL